MQTAAERTTPLPSDLVQDAAVLLRSSRGADRAAAMQLLARGYAAHEEARLARLGTSAGGDLVH